VFVVEELFLVEESINGDALGCIRSLVRAVAIKVLIPIAALVAWFRFRKSTGRDVDPDVP
jgi:hypothetical protein